MKKRSIVFGVAVASLITILFLSPLFRPGIIAGHDAGYHFTREQLFTRSLKEGQFPVRWIEGPSPGITHPLFLFYPPLFYYAVAPFMLMGISYTGATYAVIALATILAWLGMYLLVKTIIGLDPRFRGDDRGGGGDDRLVVDLAASVAATLFLFTPYRISQLYVRAAYGEFLATAFVPWAFLAVYNLYNRYNHYNRYILLLGFSLAAMVTSHQPTMIIVAAPLAAWTIYLWMRTQNTRGLAALGGAILLALGLAAFFVLPLVTEGSFIRAGRLASGYFDFRQHFALPAQLIYSPWGYGVSLMGSTDGMSFQVGFVNWVVLGGAVILVFYNYYNRYKNYNGYIGIFVLLSLSGIFMATDASAPIWERFSLLGYVQYPWRHLLVISFATAALGGLVFYNSYNVYKNYNRYIWLLLFIPILFNLKYLAPAAYMKPGMFDLGNPELARYNSPENPFFGVELGYFPIWVNEVNTDPAIKRFSVVAGKADVKTTRDTMIRQEARIEASQAATIRVNTHYFPGWMATIDDGKSKKTVTPAYDNPQGNMEVNLLEPGDYTLTFSLTKTPVRTIADYLSLVSLVAVAVGTLLIIAPRRFWSKYAGASSPARVKRSKA